MKNRPIASFLAGAATALLVTSLTVTALAASGAVRFNAVSVSVDGAAAMTAGEDITASNGQRIPGSILYTDAAGGGTNYLPVGVLSRLLGVDIRYDAATKTVLIGESAPPRWQRTVEGAHVTYRCDAPDAPAAEPPACRLNLEGWGLSGVSQSPSGSTGWTCRRGDARMDLRCAAPSSASFGYLMSGEAAAQGRQSVTVRGRSADLFQDGDRSLLIWEDQDGVLFFLTAAQVSQEELLTAAEHIEPAPASLLPCEAKWLPEGCTPFERSLAGGAVEQVWQHASGSVTLLCAAGPVAQPQTPAETVRVSGREAQFYAAPSPAAPDAPETARLPGVTLTTATVSGFGSAEMNTLRWSDPDTGAHYLLLSALDRETMVKIAENVG